MLILKIIIFINLYKNQYYNNIFRALLSFNIRPILFIFVWTNKYISVFFTTLPINNIFKVLTYLEK